MPESKDNPFVVGRTEKILSRLTEDEIYGEPNTGYAKENVYTEKIDGNSTVEYPHGKVPSLIGNGEIPIEPEDHTLKPTDVTANKRLLIW